MSRVCAHRTGTLVIRIHHNFSARAGAALLISWEHDSSIAEVANYPIWDPFVVTLVDGSGVPVISGPDANLHMSVWGYSLIDGHHLCISDYLATNGARLDGVVSSSHDVTGVSLSFGSHKFISSVCEVTDLAVLVFNVTTAAGLSLNVTSVPFNLTGGSKHCAQSLYSF